MSTMEAFWIKAKDPVFLKLLMILGGVIIAFNLIRLIVVACKVKNAVIFLHQGAEAFDGVCFGCWAIAFSSFMQGMTIVGIIAVVFAFIACYCDQKFTWIRHNNSALQEAQAMIDRSEG